MPRLWLDIGRDDRFIGQNRWLRAHLAARGVSHEWHERDGGHTWAYWRSTVAHALVWFGDALAR